MNTCQNILLASHGTEGALAAEKKALELCQKGSRLHHLIVVPSLWRGMTGDDWLTNGSTRDHFCRYLEEELSKEVNENRCRVSQAAEKHQLKYTSEVVIGEPDECLKEASIKDNFDLIVMGSPRPKGKPGLRSRMSTKATKKISVPIVIVSYPDE